MRLPGIRRVSSSACNFVANTLKSSSLLKSTLTNERESSNAASTRSSIGWVRENSWILSDACLRNAWSVRSSLPVPTTAKPAGRERCLARLYSAGSSFRPLRSPVAPKMTITAGSATR